MVPGPASAAKGRAEHRRRGSARVRSWVTVRLGVSKEVTRIDVGEADVWPRGYEHCMHATSGDAVPGVAAYSIKYDAAGRPRLFCIGCRGYRGRAPGSSL